MAKGLLNKPELLSAMLSGKYAVETACGKFISAHDLHQNAINVALESPEMRLNIVPPVKIADITTFRQCILNGIAHRKKEGLSISDEVCRIAIGIRAAIAASERGH